MGYAEADSSVDVDGLDAAHKLTILGRLAFDPDFSWEGVRSHTHGIRHLTPAIVKEAMEDGGRLRLVGSIYPEDGRWRGTVRPVYLPPEHPLSGSASNRNGLLFRGDAVGEVLITGAGCGRSADGERRVSRPDERPLGPRRSRSAGAGSGGAARLPRPTSRRSPDGWRARLSVPARTVWLTVRKYLSVRFDYRGRGITQEFNLLDVNGQRLSWLDRVKKGRRPKRCRSFYGFPVRMAGSWSATWSIRICRPTG